MNKNQMAFTESNTLIKNTIYSFLGQGAPIIVALLTIPLIIKGLGVDRFGILTLAWMITGSFSLFDLGVGRALTKMVAENLGAGKVQEIPSLVWTSMLLVVMMGLLGTLLIGIISPYLVSELLKIPEKFQTETIDTLYLLALSIPIFISSSCLLGVLAAYQRFDFINAVRIPIGTLIFLGPLLVLPFSQSVFDIVCVLVAVRIIECLANLLLCFYVEPSLRFNFSIQYFLIKKLMHFGGWLTISNIVGPLMAYWDRFLIGSILSIATVAFYSTPYEMVNRLLIIPGALVGVLFPAFSASFRQDRNYTKLIFCRGVKYVFLAMFPIILIISTLSHELLELWIGNEFAKNSALTLKWLAIGILLGSQTYIPFALLHAAARPDLTAKLHIIEAPFYFFAIWWLINIYGIEGAAIAFVFRAAVDVFILFFLSQQFLKVDASSIKSFIIYGFVSIIILMVANSLPMVMALKGSFLFLVLFTFALYTRFKFLTSEERLFLLNYIKKLKIF